VAGRTVIAVARNNHFQGIVALGDKLRADAAQTIRAMENSGLKTVLLTGDNERAARRIAREAGIEQVYADVKPGDKARIIRELQKDGRVQHRCRSKRGNGNKRDDLQSVHPGG
jgi:P-type E1-E2 ATPase